MDNELKRVLELAGVKEARGDLSYGSKNDLSIKRQDGKTLMIDLDGEDQWINTEDEEAAIEYGYYYSTPIDAERYEQDRMHNAHSQAASMFEDGEEVSTQEALADKVSIIISKLAALYPPDTYNKTKIIRLGDDHLNDPEIDVAFSTMIGIPVTKMVSITRYAATRYEPEDVDDIEEEHTVNMEIMVSSVTDNKQYISLFDNDGNDYDSVDASMDTNAIIETFSSVIDDTKLGASAGDNEYYGSYKAYKNSKIDGPDDRD